jgi:hypothetical protein
MTFQRPPCIGCGHSGTRHIDGVGLCLVKSCRLCLVYRRPTYGQTVATHRGYRIVYVADDHYRTEPNLGSAASVTQARRGIDHRLTKDDR